ncbi:MAG: hypothetical protein Q9212_006527 [Teloschistes hypoglaucus]
MPAQTFSPSSRRRSQRPVTSAPESYPVSSSTCFPFTPWLWNPKDQYSVRAFESYCRSLRSTIRTFPEHLDTRTFEIECFILLLHHAFTPSHSRSRPPFFMMAQQILGSCLRLRAAQQEAHFSQRQNNRSATRLWAGYQELIPEHARQCSEASKHENAQKRAMVWTLLVTKLGRMGPNWQQGPNAMTAEQREVELQGMQLDPGRLAMVQECEWRWSSQQMGGFSGYGTITDPTLLPTNGQANLVTLANGVRRRRSAPHPNPQAYPGAQQQYSGYDMPANGVPTAHTPPYHPPQGYTVTQPPIPDYTYALDEQVYPGMAQHSGSAISANPAQTHPAPGSAPSFGIIGASPPPPPPPPPYRSNA